jgi:adenylate kinase family enzyme
MNVLPLGPPGSGKGTQGRRLAQPYGLEHIEVGELLRASLGWRRRSARAGSSRTVSS